MAFTYTYFGGPQSTRSADRQHCAVMTAFASFFQGGKIGGELRGAGRVETARRLRDAAVEAALGHTPNAGTWFRSLMGERLGDSVPSRIEVAGATLDPYQVETVRLTTVAGGVWSVGCGLGKTLTALAAAEILAPGGRLWVCCPRNAMGTWEEYRSWMEDRFSEARVLSIDSLHNYKAVGPASGSLVIWDECHLLGAQSAQRTRHAHDIRQAFTAGLCLTGTFLHGGVGKTLSMLDLAVPGAAGFSSDWNCGRHFDCLVEKKLGPRTVTTLGKVPAGRERDFQEWLGPFCRALTKDSAEVRESGVDIPAQHVHTLPVPPMDSADDAVVRCAEALIQETGEIPHMQKVAHRACADGIGAKVELVRSMLGEKPVVIGAVYRDSLDQFAAMLEDAGVSYVRVDGGVVGRAREEAKRRFVSGEVRVFLAQADAAAVSMNLQRAHISILAEPSWRAANYDQFLARTCRRGSVRECHHFDLVANKFQAMVFRRVQAAKDFDASVAEWQQAKRLVERVASAPTVLPNPPRAEETAS